MNKNSSPIVMADARRIRELHVDRHTPLFGGKGDLLGIVAFCLLAYAVLIYYCVPTIAPQQYTRVASELQYYWQNAWYSFEYRLYTAYLPFVNSLLQQLWNYIPG